MFAVAKWKRIDETRKCNTEGKVPNDHPNNSSNNSNWGKSCGNKYGGSPGKK